MGDIRFNSRYLQTNRGVIKIIEIIIGIVLCSLLCGTWYGGRNCFYDGRLGYCSGLNFVILIINIVVFILNLLNLTMYQAERLYAIAGTVLFLIAAILIIWYIIEYDVSRGAMVAAAVLLTIMFVLFLWDVKIQQGEASN